MNQPAGTPAHVAIIMDGNGRWAAKRGLPRVAGHRAGVETVKRIAQAARDQGIAVLTLYSFSTENWARPKSEISDLFSLLKLFIRRDLAELHRNNVRIRVIGEREGVPADILRLLDDAVALTAANTLQTLVIAFNYGARSEIASAARRLAEQAVRGEIKATDITPDLLRSELDTAGLPDPDLIIRTSGEQRLSNFLLWQAAYSEFVFVEKLWPDFSDTDLRSAVETFKARKRRFGGLDPEQKSDLGAAESSLQGVAAARETAS